MTQEEAKELTLEFWRYLAEHPGIKRKPHAPLELYRKVSNFYSDCPLCELFHRGSHTCTCCPLDSAGENCFSAISVFQRWRDGVDNAKYAGRIVEIVSAWEPTPAKAAQSGQSVIGEKYEREDGGSYVDKLLVGLLTIVFVTLKLIGVISWSWLWVLSPIWILAALVWMGP